MLKDQQFQIRVVSKIDQMRLGTSLLDGIEASDFLPFAAVIAGTLVIGICRLVSARGLQRHYGEAGGALRFTLLTCRNPVRGAHHVECGVRPMPAGFASVRRGALSLLLLQGSYARREFGTNRALTVRRGNGLGLCRVHIVPVAEHVDCGGRPATAGARLAGAVSIRRSIRREKTGPTSSAVPRSRSFHESRSTLAGSRPWVSAWVWLLVQATSTDRTLGLAQLNSSDSQSRPHEFGELLD
ncbi:hypothetical protein E3T34_14710 [Cryobacterium sp. TMT1-62]|uniref:hypothetical protein n=1 Tax=Cryobacterium sp. TMT1-62 TaxID=1259240 RepID=UPI00106999A8|nr:hypothetical protein [Cryobacterium sp. TMT1-62]TFD29885.1 hypothetical protein E3T34_14710 [Cryobacterium sp. TMT1-62]